MNKENIELNKNVPVVIVEAEYEELPINDKRSRSLGIIKASLRFIFLGVLNFVEMYRESMRPKGAITIEDIIARRAVNDKKIETRYKAVAEHLNADIQNIIVQSNNEFWDVFYDGDLYKAKFNYDDDGQAKLINLAKTPFEKAKSDNSN